MSKLQDKLDGTVWLEGGCASWYLDAKGRATTLWPSTTLAFARQAKFLPQEYLLTRRPSAPAPDARAAE
jgi:hypothetical protein